jgi:hypothetical protein
MLHFSPWNRSDQFPMAGTLSGEDNFVRSCVHRRLRKVLCFFVLVLPLPREKIPPGEVRLIRSDSVNSVSLLYSLMSSVFLFTEKRRWLRPGFSVGIRLLLPVFSSSLGNSRN